MLTKTGSLLKIALSSEFKDKIRTDKTFRQAYADLNRKGGTGAEAEDLFRKFYGGGGSGAKSGFSSAGTGARAKSGFSYARDEAKRGFRQGFKDYGYTQQNYEELFKRGKNAKFKAGLAGAGLGAYAGYRAYNYFKNRNQYAN